MARHIKGMTHAGSETRNPRKQLSGERRQQKFQLREKLRALGPSIFTFDLQPSVSKNDSLIFLFFFTTEVQEQGTIPHFARERKDTMKKPIKKSVFQ